MTAFTITLTRPSPSPRSRASASAPTRDDRSPRAVRCALRSSPTISTNRPASTSGRRLGAASWVPSRGLPPSIRWRKQVRRILALDRPGEAWLAVGRHGLLSAAGGRGAVGRPLRGGLTPLGWRRFEAGLLGWA